MLTSEGVPVTTLHVSGIPSKLTREDITRHFGVYGKIVDCYLNQSKNTGRIIYALITYENSLEASKVLRSRTVINNVLLKVTSADFWHQRNMKSGDVYVSALPSPNMSPNEYVHVQDDNNIFNILDEYCFMKIFSFLPLKQLIQSERVSKRWKYLVHEKYKGIIELSSNEFNGFEMNLLLVKVGRYLKTLHLNTNQNMYENRTLFTIANLCPNLNELSIYNLISHHWSYLLGKCNKLKSLHLHECSINNNTFKNCPLKLEQLAIKESYSSTDFLEHLNLKYIIRLSLKHSSLQTILPIERCMRMRNLKELHLKDKNLDNSYITDVLKLFPQLESLNLRVDKLTTGLEPIGDMKNLKSLKVLSYAAIDNKLLMKICSNCTELTDMNISKNYPLIDITEETFTAMWSLENLTFLNACGIKVCDMSFINFVESRIHSDYIQEKTPNKIYICNNFDHVFEKSRTVICQRKPFWLDGSEEYEMYFCTCFSMKSFLLA